MAETINHDLYDRFQKKANSDDTNMVDELWPQVHPQMAKRERARKAILATLASSGDKNGMRGRCHTLLVGPPGTGKTELRDWVKHNMPTAHGVGPKSSEAGLKGDASGKELTPGALALADGGVLCIEELDKFDKGDRNALYECMSEGQYEINQGEIRTEVQAELRVVATCNGTGKFADALEDRFDFVIRMEEYDADDTVTVTDTLFDSFADAFAGGEQSIQEAVVPQYIKWVKPYEPGIADETLSTVKKMKNYLIKEKDLHGAVRKKQAWMRVAYTIAKLNRRDVTADDFIQAIDLLHPGIDSRKPLEAIRDGDVSKLY